VQDVRGSLAIVDVERFALVHTARTVAGVALLEYGSDFWARLCEFLVRDRAWVVNDLGRWLLAACMQGCCRLKQWKCRSGTYKFLAKDTRRFLDFRAHGIQVFANVGSVLGG